MTLKHKAPDHIIVRGARVHNLKNLDVDIPRGSLASVAAANHHWRSVCSMPKVHGAISNPYRLIHAGA